VLGAAHGLLASSSNRPVTSDLALEGRIFCRAGATGVQYTRNGSFHLSSTGQLVTQEVTPCWAATGPSPCRRARGDSTSGVISSDGAVAGQIKLVQFDSSVPLTSLGQGYFSAPQAAATDAGTDLGVRQERWKTPISIP